MTGEEPLADPFARVTDVLRSEFSAEELLDRLAGGCVAGLEADAAGVVVADARGDLQPSATTGGPVRALGLLQLRWLEGPALDCHRAGRRWSCARRASTEGGHGSGRSASAQGSAGCSPFRCGGRSR